MPEFFGFFLFGNRDILVLTIILGMEESPEGLTTGLYYNYSFHNLLKKTYATH
ncbi:hypothetical protein PL11201_320019 [Planktothrix sp. PCC 11201]|nr:hypothetical protein PL11201_320019 [Planktothrix sp. PCC 11201]